MVLEEVEEKEEKDREGRMRKVIVMLSILLFFGIYANAQDLAPASTNRYQIVAFPGDDSTYATVIMVDTITGTAWALFGMDNKSYEWVKINNFGKIAPIVDRLSKE